MQLSPELLSARAAGVSEPDYGVSDHYVGDKGAKYYASQSNAGEFKARIQSHTFAHLIKPTDVVLDFGCGGGFLLRALDCGRRIGVEINPVALEYARGTGLECHAQIADVPEGIADVVISNHTLEHVPYPIGALRDLRRRLKPGGLLALCVPVDNWRHHKRYDPDDRDHHLHTWTVQLLGNTLYEAGYRIESIRLWAHAWPGRWTVACYGRLPLWMFNAICYGYALVTGKGRQLVAVARPRD